MSPSRLRVSVVASDTITAYSLSALLSEQAGLEPVAQLAPNELSSVSVFEPDVLLWDFGLPSDVSAFRAVNVDTATPGRIYDAAVVGLVSDAGLTSNLWRAGLRAIVDRSASPRALVAALHAAAEGLWILSPVNGDVIPILGLADDLADVEQLSERELEVLELLAQGLTNRGIGLRLDISEHTVKFHVNSILGKLSADSRTDAVVRAMRAGMLRL